MKKKTKTPESFIIEKLWLTLKIFASREKIIIKIMIFLMKNQVKKKKKKLDPCQLKNIYTNYYHKTNALPSP